MQMIDTHTSPITTLMNSTFRWSTKAICSTALACLVLAATAAGDDLSKPDSSTPSGVPMVTAGQPLLGWQFNDASANGGSTGGLTMNSDKHDDHDSLLFSGDFSSGGNYLEISYAVPNLNVASVTMWLNSSTLTSIRLRLEDSSEQWHQMKVSIPGNGGWKKWTFSLDHYFGNKNDAAVDPAVSEYTAWNGANDQKWHGPMKSFNILIVPSTDTGSKKVSLGISEPTIQLQAASSTATP